MNYQSKNYITTSVLITCASSELSKRKRNVTRNLLPLDAIKKLESVIEETTSEN